MWANAPCAEWWSEEETGGSPDTTNPPRGQAVLWSLIASAQRHEIDVQLYLRSELAVSVT